MTRFLLFALPLLVVLTALFHLGLELVGLEPALGPSAGWEGRSGLPGSLILATWILEAVALTALFLLVDGPGRGSQLRGSRLLNALLAVWLAWVFRGPLLVMTAVGAAGEPRAPWWGLTVRWFLLYTLAGLLLAALAHLTRLGEPAAETAGTEASAAAPAEPETPSLDPRGPTEP